MDLLTVADAGLVDSNTALRILRVKRQTLYAYVSRGLVRAYRRGPGAASLYAKDDIEAIASRSRKKRDGPAPGERSLRHGGAAVLRTNVCFIADSGPVYRGVGALDMARAGWCFERCAEHLWNFAPASLGGGWNADHVAGFVAAHLPVLRAVCQDAAPPLKQQLLLAAYNAGSAGDAALRDEPAEASARRIVQILAASLQLGPLQAAAARTATPAGPLLLAQQIAAACRRPASADTLRAIDAALILCADHELAPATFVARIAASAGADLFACALSALGAFEGHSPTLGCDAFEQRLLDAPSTAAYVDALSGLIAQRQPLAGYTHPLYPRGDPRAAHLIGLARTLAASGNPGAAALLHRVEQAHDSLGLAPSIIAAMVLLSHALGLPGGTASSLMSVGRCAGWIAHCVEQRQRGYKLRPHAAYTG